METNPATTPHNAPTPAPRRASKTKRNPTARVVENILGYAETRMGQAVQHVMKHDKSWLAADVAEKLLRRTDRIVACALTLRSLIETEFPSLRRPQQ